MALLRDLLQAPVGMDEQFPPPVDDLAMEPEPPPPGEAWGGPPPYDPLFDPTTGGYVDPALEPPPPPVMVNKTQEPAWNGPPEPAPTPGIISAINEPPPWVQQAKAEGRPTLSDVPVLGGVSNLIANTADAVTGEGEARYQPAGERGFGDVLNAFPPLSGIPTVLSKGASPLLKLGAGALGADVLEAGEGAGRTVGGALVRSGEEVFGAAPPRPVRMASAGKLPEDTGDVFTQKDLFGNDIPLPDSELEQRSMNLGADAPLGKPPPQMGDFIDPLARRTKGGADLTRESLQKQFPQGAPTIPTEEIVTNPAHQPRVGLDEANVKRIIDTFDINKFQPVDVREVAPGKYELIHGHHRFAAAQRLGLPDIPARVLNVSSEDAIRLAEEANISGKTLTPTEIARILDRRLQLGEAPADIAKAVPGANLRPNQIEDFARITLLPRVAQEAVDDAVLGKHFTAAHAVALAKAQSKYGMPLDEVQAFFNEVVMKGDLTPSQLTNMLDNFAPVLREMATQTDMFGSGDFGVAYTGIMKTIRDSGMFLKELEAVRRRLRSIQNFVKEGREVPSELRAAQPAIQKQEAALAARISQTRDELLGRMRGTGPASAPPTGEQTASGITKDTYPIPARGAAGKTAAVPGYKVDDRYFVSNFDQYGRQDPGTAWWAIDTTTGQRIGQRFGTRSEAVAFVRGAKPPGTPPAALPEELPPAPPPELPPAGNLPPAEPPPPPKLPDPEDVPSAKERGLAKSLRTKPGTDETIREWLESTRQTYDPVSNEAVRAEATRQITQDPVRAYVGVMEARGPMTNIEARIAEQLYQEAIALGDFDRAEAIVTHAAMRATENGRGVQAYTGWGRLSPEGVVKFVAGVKAKAAKNGKHVNVPEGKIGTLVKEAEAIQQMPPGLGRDIAEAKLGAQLKQIAQPPSAGSKAAALLRIAQLLNPKTIITRNELSNAINMVFSNLSDVVATGMDVGLSAVTGQRSRVLPNIGMQLRGGMAGAVEEARAISAGLGTGRGASRYGPGAFAAGPAPLKWAEKALSYGMGVPDAFHWRAAFDEEVYQQVRTRVMNSGLKGEDAQLMELKLFQSLPKDVAERAAARAAYAVYEHPNVFSWAAQHIKEGLNVGKEFGLGNFVLNYPRVPGGLLSIAIDYSPFGILKAIPDYMHTLRLGKDTPIEVQRRAADQLGRGLTGSIGLTIPGAFLASQGIVTVQEVSENRREAELLQSAGVRRYQFNVDAFKRGVTSLFNPKETKRRQGDFMFTFDWDVPRATSVALGAALAKGKKRLEQPEPDVWQQMGQFFESVSEPTMLALDMLTNSSMFQGVSRLFSQGTITDGIANVLKSAPSAFMPTLLNQMNQLSDNYIRETYDPSGLREAFNRVVARLPIIAAGLPERVGPLGEDMERQQLGNDPWNVFLNPASATRYLPSQEANFLLNLYATTGDTGVLPRDVPKRLRIDDQTYELSPEQYSRYQEVLGKATREAVGKLMENPTFKGGSELEQAKMIATTLTELNVKTKDLLRQGVLTVGPRNLPPPPTPTPTRTPTPAPIRRTPPRPAAPRSSPTPSPKRLRDEFQRGILESVR